MKQQEAPGRLEIVRGFINTLDHEAGTDAFGSATGVQRWFATHLGAPEPPSTISETERQAVVGFRELLRAAAAANGIPASPELDWLTGVNEIATRSPLRLWFGEGLVPAPQAPDSGLQGAFAELLWIVAVSAINGTWIRLKVCPAQDCRWAFYDNAKNRMGVWCQMAECGNRRKARTYRDRQQLATSPEGTAGT
jgi:predicted RNA-binding Zn ribbon-like protein